MNFKPKGINFSNPTKCSSNNSPCFWINYCIYLDSILFDFKKHELTFNVNLTVPDRNLDLKEQRIINGKLNETFKIKSNQYCSEKPVNFFELKDKEDIFDIITPIEVQLSVELETPKTNKFCSNCPIGNHLTIFQEVCYI